MCGPFTQPTAPLLSQRHTPAQRPRRLSSSGLGRRRDSEVRNTTRTHGYLRETRVDGSEAPPCRHSLNSRVRSTLSFFFFFVSLRCELCVFVSIASQGSLTACRQAKKVNAEQQHLGLILYNILFLLVVKWWVSGLVDGSRLVLDSFTGCRTTSRIGEETSLSQ